MSRRGIVVDSLISSISEATEAAGHRGMRFLHEINSFPSFYVHVTNESRAHISHGVRYGLLDIAIRGYQWSDNLDAIELFARTIESAVDTFYRSNRDMVDETRVTSLSTDEGTLAPYGAVDISVTILYAVNDGTNQPIKTINYDLQDSAGNTLQAPDGSILTIPSEFK